MKLLSIQAFIPMINIIVLKFIADLTKKNYEESEILCSLSVFNGTLENSDSF